MPGQRLATAAISTLLFLSLSCEKTGSDHPLEPVPNEPEDASISGTVLVGETPLGGVGISLSGPETSQARTDAQGAFSFSQLKRGTYSLVLSGFDPDIHAFPTTSLTVPAVDGTPRTVDFVGSLLPQPPAPATGLQLLALGPETMELSWTDESDDETGFKIERKDGPAGAWAVIGTTGVDAVSFLDQGLTPNTTYGYRIQACNDAGCSSYTTEAQATTDEIPPAAPSGLVAQAAGSTAISLTWSDLAGNEDGFQIDRKEPTDPDWIELATTEQDVVAFSDQGLTPATTYRYRVRACNLVGCSEYTGEAAASTDDIPPQPPVDLNAVAAGSSIVDLTWTDGSDNETEFQVERITGADGSWSQVGSTGVDEAAFQDQALEPLTSYRYRVRACNDFGCSGFSNEATATTTELTPKTPSGLSATSAGTEAVELAWTDESHDETGFKIERRIGAEGSWMTVGATGENTVGLLDTGLSPNTTYRYRVQACNDAGCSPYTTEAQATTEDIPPAAPTELVAEAAGSTAISLAWSDVSGNEDGFQIERKEPTDSDWTELATVEEDLVAFSDQGLAPATTYLYRVRACNPVGCSAYTGEAAATTDDIPPQPPVDLDAVAAGSSIVDLTWSDESGNETEFQVEKREGSDGSWAPAGSTGSNEEAFRDRELDPLTSYSYRVRACNDFGCSGFSNEATATTGELTPKSPSGLSATSAGTDAIELAWTDESDNETEFRIQRRKTSGGTWTQIVSLGPDASGYDDSGLESATEYAYRIDACNGGGCSDFSNEATATTEGSSGTNLFISSLYIVQSTQSLDGDVPLVANKAGFLRVFALASGENDLQPDVRVRFYHDGSLVHTETVSAPGASVPTSVSESSLAYSWNVEVSKSLIVPGLSILAEVDPENLVAEADEADNRFPASGTPMTLDVRNTSSFRVTFVPVLQNVNGLVGNVSAGNADDFFDDVLERLPIADTDANIHAEYATDAEVLENDNANGAWGTVLSEVNALRVAEGSSRSYYGVVKTDYTSGVAGMGYLGWPAAVGWDRLPSGAGVAAHEWGHNWNRRHAPGCGAGSPDESYPYADGKIGLWGMDVGPNSLKSPATYFDFMSYCGPDWVSDYSYEAILNDRESAGAVAVSGVAEPSLLVWGRVEDGEVFLEPAFEVDTRATLPRQPGQYRMEGLASTGASLFALSFDLLPVPDGKPGEGHFAFAIPLGSFEISDLARIRVRGSGGRSTFLEPTQGPQRVEGAGLEVLPIPGASAEVVWEDATHPMALVRDATTGEILSFARGGIGRFSVASEEILITLSDGLRSTRPVRRRVR